MIGKIREMDTIEWKNKVRREAIQRNGNGGTIGPAIDLGAPPGFDLDVGTKIRVITEARENTGLAAKV
jgi:hypothetical protein